MVTAGSALGNATGAMIAAQAGLDAPKRVINGVSGGLVAALGGFGAHATSREDLDVVLTQAIASGLPACIIVAMVGLAAPTF